MAQRSSNLEEQSIHFLLSRPTIINQIRNASPACLQQPARAVRYRAVRYLKVGGAEAYPALVLTLQVVSQAEGERSAGDGGDSHPAAVERDDRHRGQDPD